MRRSLARVVVFALFAVALVSGAAAQRISRIAFFGDSLTDSGNNFIFTGQSTRTPFPVGPAAFSYNIGGHHYSNGQVWAEYLTAALQIPNSGKPSLRAPGGVFTNYAVGDARTRAGAPAFPYFDLTTQVSRFLNDFHGRVQADTLVVIWMGANDLDDALNALTTDASGATSLVITEDALAAIGTNVQTLYAAGARMFLIVDVPDLSKTPYVRFLGQSDPTIPVIASQFSTGFNAALAAESAPLGALPGMQYFRFFDVDGLLDAVIASPGSFHFEDVTDRCTVPNVKGNAICDNPDAFLFWDATHPTTAGHRTIAAAALSILPPQ